MSCRDFQLLIKDEWFLLVISSQGFAAICSAAISLFAIRKCMDLHFHVNCRASHVVRFILYDSCEATISSALCFALRLPAGICVASFAVLQLGMILERAIALWRRQHYETSGAMLGYVIAGCCIFTGAVMATWSMLQMDLNTEVVYCSTSTTATADRLRTRTFTQCVINVFALLCAGLIYYYNAAAIKRRYFDLHSSYQLQENVDVINVFIPLSMFQAIFHLFFSISAVVLLTFRASNPTTTYRTIMASFYIIPYYTLASPALLLLLLRSSSQKRTAKIAALPKIANEQTYFDAYAKMWAVTLPSKN
ncbi:unnamed protein product [Cylicocyclus nassatus]|uniref:Uncharacterized protein n=1 Tax=Cylicocyclus nassatus TaxID=53992 RepID=A0AA36ME28_CYLNA|nr:unnamed protein product [Cylicocyclus nassatus]